MRRTLSLLWIFVACASCASQQLSSTEVSALAAHAGIIFRGRVAGTVLEPPKAPGELPTLRITLRVDEGIRGAITGQTITIRQWNSAPGEYRVGESLVLFLYAPSDELGITSPVAGKAGYRRPDEVPASALVGLSEPPPTEVPAVAPVPPTRKPQPKILPARRSRALLEVEVEQ